MSATKRSLIDELRANVADAKCRRLEREAKERDDENERRTAARAVLNDFAPRFIDFVDASLREASHEEKRSQEVLLNVGKDDVAMVRIHIPCDPRVCTFFEDCGELNAKLRNALLTEFPYFVRTITRYYEPEIGVSQSPAWRGAITFTFTWAEKAAAAADEAQ